MMRYWIDENGWMEYGYHRLHDHQHLIASHLTPVQHLNTPHRELNPKLIDYAPLVSYTICKHLSRYITNIVCYMVRHVFESSINSLNAVAAYSHSIHSVIRNILRETSSKKNYPWMFSGQRIDCDAMELS